MATTARPRPTSTALPQTPCSLKRTTRPTFPRLRPTPPCSPASTASAPASWPCATAAACPKKFALCPRSSAEAATTPRASDSRATQVRVASAAIWTTRVGVPLPKAAAPRPKTSTKSPSPSWSGSRAPRSPSSSSCATWTRTPPICRRPRLSGCFTAATNSTPKTRAWSRCLASSPSATSLPIGCRPGCATATTWTPSTTVPSPIWTPAFSASSPASKSWA